MSAVLAASDSTNPLVAIVLIAFGAVGWWNGVKTWRGEQPAKVARYEAQQGPVTTVIGTRRQYQSRAGMGHVGLLIGPAFVVVGVGEAARAALGQDRDWWLFWIAVVAAAILLLASFVYILAYSFTGVPDRWRPPCQRGWEIVDGELRLVRPEAFHEHPKHRPWQPDGDAPRGYDPWR